MASPKKILGQRLAKITTCGLLGHSQSRLTVPEVWVVTMSAKVVPCGRFSPWCRFNSVDEVF